MISTVKQPKEVATEGLEMHNPATLKRTVEKKLVFLSFQNNTSIRFRGFSQLIILVIIKVIIYITS